MELTKTFTDAQLKARVAGMQRMMAKCKPGSWTWGKLNESLQGMLEQLALPRSQRQKWATGSL